MKVKAKVVFSALACVLASSIAAAPFKGFFPAVTSLGKEYSVYGEGDEFDAVFETEDGWTVMSKDGKPGYWYAVPAGDKLIASDVEVGFETPVIPSTLPKHLRDSSEEHAAEVCERVAKDEAACGTRAAWEARMGAASTEETGWFSRLEAWVKELFGGSPGEESAEGFVPLAAPPKTATVGEVVGFTVLVDFPVKGSSETEAQRVHPGVGLKEIDKLLNSTEPAKYTFNYSVRQFYADISHGRLDFSNVVADYVLLDKPRSYYDNESKDCGDCAAVLMRDVVAKLKSTGRWESEVAPALQGVTYNPKTKRFLSLSVLFAGNSASKWCYGLWAHKSTTGAWPAVLMADGKTKVKFSTYQISPITAYPHISTFCHECGHMVCGFPDLYDYTKKTKGAGMYTLMASNTSAPIDPYLAAAAGWIDPKPLPEQGWVEFPKGRATVYKYPNPNDAKQYFLIENRQPDGLDAEMPGEGIIIWRCNHSGSNTSGGRGNIGKGANMYRRNFELSIVQADGRYDLERKSNSGEDEDFWKEDNKATSYVNEVSDNTTPDLVWKNNSASGLRLSRFSKSSDVMKAWVGDDTIKLPVEVETHGFDGKYDRKAHKISVLVKSPEEGVTVTYCKTQDGKYSKTNPSYRTVGEHVTWFRAVADGHLSTNGCEKVVICK